MPDDPALRQLSATLAGHANGHPQATGAQCAAHRRYPGYAGRRGVAAGHRTTQAQATRQGEQTPKAEPGCSQRTARRGEGGSQPASAVAANAAAGKSASQCTAVAETPAAKAGRLAHRWPRWPTPSRMPWRQPGRWSSPTSALPAFRPRPACSTVCICPACCWAMARCAGSVEDGAYSLITDVTPVVGPKLRYETVGNITPQGLRPERFKATRDGQPREYAQFDWAGGTLAYGDKEAKSEPLQAGAQDWLSLGGATGAARQEDGRRTGADHHRQEGIPHGACGRRAKPISIPARASSAPW